MFRIALERAQAVGGEMNLTEAQVTRSDGYKKLRAFYVRLSDRAKLAYRKHLRSQLTGIEQLIAKAKETGEAFSYGDIEIDIIDARTGSPVSAPNFNQGDETEHDDGKPDDDTEHHEHDNRGRSENASPQATTAVGDRGDHQDR